MSTESAGALARVTEDVVSLDILDRLVIWSWSLLEHLALPIG